MTAGLGFLQVIGKRKKLVSDAAEGAVLEARGEALASGPAVAEQECYGRQL